MTHICVSKLTIIGSDNGLSPGCCQAIIWTNAGILLIGHLETNSNQILFKIHTFLCIHSSKCIWKCLQNGSNFISGLNVLNLILSSGLINKANLRDLIAATSLVILLKLDLNRWFFSPCDLEIWWMTPKNNRAPLLCYFKLFASFRSHWRIQTGVTVRKRLIWVNIDAFFSRVTLKFDGWPSKTIGHLFYATSSFVQHFVAIGEFKLELQSGNAQSGSNATLFRAVWPWNLTDDLEKQ